MAPTIGRSKESSFGAWVKAVGGGGPLLGRVKEVAVVHVQGREDSRRRGAFRVNMGNHRPLIN